MALSTIIPATWDFDFSTLKTITPIEWGKGEVWADLRTLSGGMDILGGGVARLGFGFGSLAPPGRLEGAAFISRMGTWRGASSQGRREGGRDEFVDVMCRS